MFSKYRKCSPVKRSIMQIDKIHAPKIVKLSFDFEKKIKSKKTLVVKISCGIMVPKVSSDKNCFAILSVVIKEDESDDVILSMSTRSKIECALKTDEDDKRQELIHDQGLPEVYAQFREIYKSIGKNTIQNLPEIPPEISF